MVAFDNFQNNYPDSEYIEEIRFLEIEAMFKLAEVSIPSKKKERYNSSIDFYQNYIEDYPNGEYLRKAEKVYEDTLDQLRKIKI